MKNYVCLLLLSSITILCILISINIYQINITPLIILFLIIILSIIGIMCKNLSHIMEKLEITFMLIVLIGLLYTLYYNLHFQPF